MENKKFISPAGFGIAVISFFLPWVGIQCSGQTLERYSGVQLSNRFPVLWIVLAIAVFLTVAFFYFNTTKKLHERKDLFSWGGIIAIGTIVVSYVYAESSGIDFMGEKIPLKEVGFRFEFGIIPEII